jgi:hypothetical protein
LGLSATVLVSAQGRGGAPAPASGAPSRPALDRRLLRILVWQLGPLLYVMGGLFLVGAGCRALVDPRQPVFAEA